MMKFCKKCQTEKLFEEFYKNKAQRDGLTVYCKECDKAAALLWAKNNPERINARNRKWAAANLENAKNRKQRWRDKDRDLFNQKQREYRQKNPTSGRESCLKWQKNNRGKVNAATSAYRALKLQSSPNWLTAIQKAQIQEFYDVALAISMQTGIKHHVDHIHPLKGDGFNGLHVPWNLAVITAAENISKTNKLPDAHILGWGS